MLIVGHDLSRASRPTSRSSARRSTASASSTSTPRRRHRSPTPCSTRWTSSTASYYANIHRGVYTIAEESTAAYEAARAKIARFLRRASANESGVHQEHHRSDQPRSRTRGRAPTSAKGDAIVVTEMEHHANVVPWHILCAERGVELRWVPLTATTSSTSRTSTGCSTAPSSSRSPRCPTCSAPSTTSALLADAGHAAGARCSSTRAQAVPHGAVDVQCLGRRLRRLHRPQDAAAPAESGRSGPAPSCSRRCRRSSAAAR